MIAPTGYGDPSVSRLQATLCILVFVVVSVPAPGQRRVWHYTDGRSFTADYQWSSPETLHLKSGSGKEFIVPLGALSNSDLEYVRGIQSRFTEKGVVWHAPLVWEEYRSKNFTAQEAQQAGYFPLDSQTSSEGTLRLEFRRFGPVPKLAPGQRLVLRLTTAKRPGAGTRSSIQVIHSRRVVGQRAGVGADRGFDIPLAPVVLQGSSRIVFEVRCGSDTVYLKTENSGAGPQLLIVESESE